MNSLKFALDFVEISPFLMSTNWGSHHSRKGYFLIFGINCSTFLFSLSVRMNRTINIIVDTI